VTESIVVVSSKDPFIEMVGLTVVSERGLSVNNEKIIFYNENPY
jgi:hypothetical protein